MGVEPDIAMRFLGLLLCLCSVAAMADELYKWTDPDGHVHYTQSPPADTSLHAEKVHVAAPQHYDSHLQPPTVYKPVPAGSTAPAVPATPEELAEERAVQHKADVAARKKLFRDQKCQDLREQLLVSQQANPSDPAQEIQDQLAASCSNSNPP